MKILLGWNEEGGSGDDPTENVKANGGEAKVHSMKVEESC